MSDEDDSATAFIMQWRWPIKYKTLLSVRRYTVISATIFPTARGRLQEKRVQSNFNWALVSDTA